MTHFSKAISRRLFYMIALRLHHQMNIITITLWSNILLALWTTLIEASFFGYRSMQQQFASKEMNRNSKLRLSSIICHSTSNFNPRRRDMITCIPWSLAVSSPYLISTSSFAQGIYSGPMIDVNNAVAREYTAFPGYVDSYIFALDFERFHLLTSQWIFQSLSNNCSQTCERRKRKALYNKRYGIEISNI